MSHVTSQKALHKAEVMENKTKVIVFCFQYPFVVDSLLCEQFAIETFELPATEDVVQDYHCSWWKGVVPVQGHMYITESVSARDVGKTKKLMCCFFKRMFFFSILVLLF
jgi:hypothetical protein